MKTETELNNDIFNLTIAIQRRFPELARYISELPVALPCKADAHINVRALTDYYNSLNLLQKDYTLCNLDWHS